MTYEAIAESLAASHGTVSSQMFGKPCLKVGGKAFAAFFKDCMVFKLGREEMPLLLDQYPGSELWDPSGKGRAMKDWLQVPADYAEDWSSRAKQALTFVAG